MTSNFSLCVSQGVFLAWLLSVALSSFGVIFFTLMCGLTYDVGMSDKYGGLRTSTIYNANVTDYIVCEHGGFNTYAPIASFERFGQVINCVLQFSGGIDDTNCRAINEINHTFPYGSNIDLYLNTNKYPYCVTKDYLEENSYLGYQFLLIDMACVAWLIVTILMNRYIFKDFKYLLSSNLNNQITTNI